MYTISLIPSGSPHVDTMGVHRTRGARPPSETELAATCSLLHARILGRYHTKNTVSQQCVHQPKACRPISPQWGSIRFRLALRTYAQWGLRVVSLTKSRKIPTRKYHRHPPNAVVVVVVAAGQRRMSLSCVTLQCNLLL